MRHKAQQTFRCSIQFGILILSIILSLLSGSIFPSQWQATERATGFAQAINKNQPRTIYSYLLPNIQSMLSPEEFVDNFVKERSYPYLTPLYIYLDEVKLSEDKLSGEATFTVAARLPGEKMKVKLYYINGQYVMDAFRDVANGSYLLKFQKLKS